MQLQLADVLTSDQNYLKELAGFSDGEGLLLPAEVQGEEFDDVVVLLEQNPRVEG